MRCVSFLWFLLSNENPYRETPYQKSSSKPPPVSVTEDVDEISTISVNTCTKAIKGFESRNVVRSAYRIAGNENLICRHYNRSSIFFLQSFIRARDPRCRTWTCSYLIYGCISYIFRMIRDRCPTSMFQVRNVIWMSNTRLFGLMNFFLILLFMRRGGAS